MEELKEIMKKLDCLYEEADEIILEGKSIEWLLPLIKGVNITSVKFDAAVLSIPSTSEDQE